MKPTIILLFLFLLVRTGFSQTPDWAWAKSLGGDHDEHALCITNDGAGNSYAAGFFQSLSVVFGGDTLENPGYYSYEMFIV